MYSRLYSWSELCCPWIWCTLIFNCVILPADLGSMTFKCNRLHYNYFAIFMITLHYDYINFQMYSIKLQLHCNVIDYITDYIWCHYNQYISVLCYFVLCASVQYHFFFYVFLTQNYELQFSFNVIITCNNKQYIVNYKHFNSNSPFPIFHKICLLLLLYMTTYRIE